MRYRAYTLEGTTVKFDLSDLPVSISADNIVLVNRPNSPILIATTIMRGDDTLDVYESDFILDRDTKKFLGNVVYKDKFYLFTVDSKMVPLSEVEDFIVCHNCGSTNINLGQERSYINFIADGRMYSLKRIMFGDSEKFYVDLKSGNNGIDICKMMPCTGVLQDESTEYYFNQVLDDGVVVLHNYEPCVKMFGTGKCESLERRSFNGYGVTSSSECGTGCRYA